MMFPQDMTNLPLAARHLDIHEAPSVCDSLLGATLGELLLLLWLNLDDARRHVSPDARKRRFV